MKGDFISCYLLLQPALRNVSCEKNYTPSKQRYYRSTIKMHESSPIAAALFFLFHLSATPTDGPHKRDKIKAAATRLISCILIVEQ